MEKDSSPVQLQFIGAAGTVTGSRTFLQTDKYKILIDCGLFQGKKSERKLNKLKQLPFKPSELDAIILTHGHLDHSGYLPVLVKKGFTGPIYATAPTKDITEIILFDSAKIQKEDTHEANKRRKKGKKQKKPLYRNKHVKRTMELFKTFDDNQWVSLNEESKLCFQMSGHILGSATVELECKGRKFVFSGDLGQQVPLILNPPTRQQEADYIIMESTYGDKVHDRSVSPFQALQEVVNKTFEKGGVLVIPSFAVERAQEIILILNSLMEEKSIPSLPIYLDSPMGIDVTKLFQEHRKWHTLTDPECDTLTKNVHLIRSFEETLNVLHEDGPKQKIIIAGSGMATGGRVLYYLKQLLSDKKNTILLVGYQAAGTRGRKLLSGKSHVKIDGKRFDVSAEISQIGSLSAHADQEDLLWWLSQFKKAPRQLFLNHGEQEAASALKQKVEDTYQWKVTVAGMDKVYQV